MSLSHVIKLAQSPSPWDVGNGVLYELCSSRPAHKRVDDVVAKIWLIGRAYAAAIERRRNKSDQNEDYYLKIVAPAIIKSPLDNWIKQAKKHDFPSTASLPTLLHVHHATTQLFSRISGLEKRSLASKYLHFHVPQLFYIYDTRALEALRTFSHLLPRSSPSDGVGDNEYRKFVDKCLSLQTYIESKYGKRLSPRELDMVLLHTHRRLT